MDFAGPSNYCASQYGAQLADEPGLCAHGTQFSSFLPRHVFTDMFAVLAFDQFRQNWGISVLGGRGCRQFGFPKSII